MKQITADLIDLVLPRRCHVCDEKLIGDEKFICTQCIGELPRTLYHRYWLNTQSVNSDLNPMETRFAGLVPFEHATSAFFYSRDSKLAQLAQDFKYRKFPNLARRLGAIAATDLLPTGFFTGIDCILPIPLHWMKRIRRGYNQCEHIARGISDVTGIPVRRNLVAKRGHKTQTHLTRDERIKNLDGVFDIRKAEEIDGLSILLVDDICTTGTTLTTAALKITEACPQTRLSFMTLGCTY